MIYAGVPSFLDLGLRTSMFHLSGFYYSSKKIPRGPHVYTSFLGTMLKSLGIKQVIKNKESGF